MRAARFGAGTPGRIGMTFALSSPIDLAALSTPYIRRGVHACRGLRRWPTSSPATPARGSCTRSSRTSRVRCFACGHRCLIPPGQDGVCRVRFNEGGTLKVPARVRGRAAGRPGGEEALLPRPARRRARCPSGCSAATTTAATASCRGPRSSRPAGRARSTRCSTAAAPMFETATDAVVAAPRGRRRHPPRPRAAGARASSATTTAGR